MAITLGDALLFLKADDTAVKRTLAETQNNTERMLGGIEKSVRGIFAVQVAGILKQAGDAAINWGRQMIGSAFEATASYERMSLSLESLVALEISRGQKSTETSQVVQTLSAQEKEKLVELQEQYRLNQIALEKQKSTIAAAAEKHGQNSLAVEEATIRYNQLERKLQETGSAIESLSSKEGQLATVTKQVVTGAMSLSDAMGLAGPRAKELLNWIEQLSIQSPFSQTDTAEALQQAMAYGFTSQEAQRLTQAVIDYAAASGRSGAVMGQVNYALGQIRTSDKLLMQDLRQLINAGIDVNAILETMGYSLNDVGNEAIDSKAFVGAFMATLEGNYGGAAKKQASSLAGLAESFKDLGAAVQRDLFGPALQSFQPLLAAIVDKLTQPKLRESLQKIGAALGTMFEKFLPSAESVAAFMDKVVGRITYFMDATQNGKPVLEALRIVFLSLIPVELRDALLFLEQKWNGLIAQAQPLIAFVSLLAAWFGQNLPGAVMAAGEVWNTYLVPALQAFQAFLQSEYLPYLGTLAAVLYQALGESVKQLVPFWNEVLLPALQGFLTWAQAHLVPLFFTVQEWLFTNIPIALKFLTDAWNNVLLPALISFWTWMLQNFFPFFGTLYEWLETNIPQAIQTLTDFWNNTLWPALMAIYDWWSTTLQPFLEAVSRLVGVLLVEAVEALAKIWEGLLLRLQPVFDFFNKHLGPILAWLDNFIRQNFLPILKEMEKWIGGTLQLTLGYLRGEFDAISKAIQAATGFINDFIEAVAGVPSTAGGRPIGPGRAGGGKVYAGTTYPVGEEGPELFTPKQDGYIIPNDKLGSVIDSNNKTTIFQITMPNSPSGNNGRSLEETVSFLQMAYGGT